LSERETFQGLTAAEAARRLCDFGPNELPAADRRRLLNIVYDTLQEPLLLLLIAASAIYIALGDIGEGGLLMALALVDVGIVVYQDLKTERVLEALRDLASPRALVIRDGMLQRIAGRDVVPGDIMVVEEGDRVAADAWVISATDLTADESLLTGESVPVRKRVADSAAGPPPRPGGNDVPFVFSGSIVVHGQCTTKVAATGANSEIGRIGKSLSHIQLEETRIRRVTRRLAFWMTIAGVAVSALVVGFQGLRTGNWLIALLSGLTIAMSMLPEELPIILTVFLTLGAWRISRRQVLTRQIAAIESLGAATILCTDKTGTLTVNRMTVTRLWTEGREYILSGSNPVPDEAMSLLRTAALASQMQAVDPMERAFQSAAAGNGVSLSTAPVRIYGLTPELLAVTHVRMAGVDNTYDVAAKGAPEAVASLCRLGASERAELLRQTNAMAEDGLRVLAVAAARHEGPLPETPSGFTFLLLGLAGLSDPVRETVPEAVAECRRAGIRVVMITGDFPATALAIARQVGIDGGKAVTGDDMASLSDDELDSLLRKVNVFARIMPEQKLRIVRALKAQGEIVAMTGDGVNDAPALKAAHIGIAMGGRGTDVAREAAALVLLDDAFESIVAAVRLGRRIFDNLRKAISYVFAVHVPIAGVALAPFLLGWPIVFSPVHIVFLELVIDPVCSIAFEAEPEEADIMRRPPRDPKISVFEGRDILFSLVLGGFGLLAILTVYGLALASGVPETEARAVAFIAIVTGNLALILASRSRFGSFLGGIVRPNAVLWGIIATTTALLFIIVYTSYPAALFRFSPPTGALLLLALFPAVAVMIAAELAKFVRCKTKWGKFLHRPS